MPKSLTYILISFVLALFFIIVTPTYVEAQCEPGQCTDWCTTSYTCTVQDQYGNDVSGWCTSFFCCYSPDICGSCNPGTYPCNGGSGCCDIGSTPPPGSGGGGGGSCTVTAPTNLNVSRTSPTEAHVTWTPGSGGNGQIIDVGENKTEVDSGCPGISSPACVVNDSLSSSASSYDTGSILIPGTVYYYKIFNFDSTLQSCNSSSATTPALSSCLINPSTRPITIPNGGSQDISTQVNSNSIITNVFYSLDPAGFASFNSASFVSSLTDSTYPYSTTIYGLAGGSTQLTSTVNSASGVLCSDTATITVEQPQAWWQVKDSDVQSNGSLSSDVPSGEYFGDVGLGGYPGVPAAVSAPTFGLGSASQIGWVAQSSWLGSKTFDYQYFNNLIPDEATPHIYPIGDTFLDQSVIDANSNTYPGTGSNTDYLWYKYDGYQHAGSDLTVTGDISVGTKKIILLVENANLLIDSRIANVTKGSGFFLAIVNGSIEIDPTIGSGNPDLEGLYVADDSFKDGTLQPGSNDQTFHLRGAAVAYGEGGGDTIVLQRDLGDTTNETTPSEIFEFAPDQLMLFPSILGYRRLNWKEVAP